MRDKKVRLTRDGRITQPDNNNLPDTVNKHHCTISLWSIKRISSDTNRLNSSDNSILRVFNHTISLYRKRTIWSHLSVYKGRNQGNEWKNHAKINAKNKGKSLR